MSASKPGLGKYIFSRLDSRRNAFRNPLVTVGFHKNPFLQKNVAKNPSREGFFVRQYSLNIFVCLAALFDMMLSE